MKSMSNNYHEEDSDAENSKAYVLYLKNISKTFGSNKALDRVDLKIKPGEIHGLIGQNGCGKSTLIKILAGFYTPDEGGMLWVKGEKVIFPLSPGEFKKYGMSFVHQDLGLIPDLTVLENLCISKLASSGAMHIDWEKEHKNAREIFTRYHVDVDERIPVASLGPVQKAMLAIVRAVEEIKYLSAHEGGSKKRGLLVLDEPTVFLPRAEVDTLFGLVREIANEGMSVIFVSHDLDEVIELTDSFTVLRDGVNCGSRNTADVKKEEIIEMILGKKLKKYLGHESGANHVAKNQAMMVNDLNGDIINNVSFIIYEGEILGLTGLVGSGFEEVSYLLFGALENQSGMIEIEGKRISVEYFNPKKAVSAKMALIPADRPNAGAIRELEVGDNIMMQVMERYNPLRLRKRNMYTDSLRLIDQYKIQPNNPKMDLGELSGGNQQKVLLAKWLQDRPRVIILHEPTQGIDVGARQQVYHLIDTAAEEGAAVLCSSSDYEQLEQICDRVLIFVHGKIVKELVGSEIKKEHIVQLCYDSTGMC